MTRDTYERFDAATRTMSAYAITLGRKGPNVGRLVTVASKSNASVRAYMQFWGAPMVDAQATGYGYDKQGAAFALAFDKLRLAPMAERGADHAAAMEAARSVPTETVRNVVSGAGFLELRHALEAAGLFFDVVI